MNTGEDKKIIHKVLADAIIRKHLCNITTNDPLTNFRSMRVVIDRLKEILIDHPIITTENYSASKIIGSVKKIIFNSIPNLLDYFETLPPTLFKNVDGIKSIKLNSNVSSLDRGVFILCDDLEELDMGDSRIESLDPSELFNKKLTRLVLPKTITYISADNLVSCDLLTEIEFRGTREQWHKDVGWSYTHEGFGNVKLVKCIDGDMKVIFNDKKTEIKFEDI